MIKSDKLERIVVLGEHGAGKTSIGRGLAKALSLGFYDINAMVEERSGVDLSWIAAVEGEAGIYRRTQKVLQELLDKDHIVIAAGNAVVFDDLKQVLSHAGIIVYLEASTSERLTRLAGRHRMTKTLPPQTEPASNPHSAIGCFDYKTMADIVINTDNLSRPAVIDALSRQLSPKEGRRAW